MPGILMFAVMAVVTLIIWAVALNRPPDVTEAAACNPPVNNVSSDPTQSKLGERVTRASMTEVGPANLADTKIRVLNASGQGGQAAEVAGQLRDLGFADPTAENDPLYGSNRLSCQGQIRFGPAGRAAAAAVWLVAPCVELYQDQRPDNTVDLAVGTEFGDLSHNDDTDAVLPSLRPDATQPADPSMLAKVHAGA